MSNTAALELSVDEPEANAASEFNVDEPEANIVGPLLSLIQPVCLHIEQQQLVIPSASCDGHFLMQIIFALKAAAEKLLCDQLISSQSLEQSDLIQCDTMQRPTPSMDACNSTTLPSASARNSPPAGSTSVSTSDLKKGEAVVVWFKECQDQAWPAGWYEGSVAIHRNKTVTIEFPGEDPDDLNACYTVQLHDTDPSVRRIAGSEPLSSMDRAAGRSAASLRKRQQCSRASSFRLGRSAHPTDASAGAAAAAAVGSLDGQSISSTSMSLRLRPPARQLQLHAKLKFWHEERQLWIPGTLERIHQGNPTRVDILITGPKDRQSDEGDQQTFRMLKFPNRRIRLVGPVYGGGSISGSDDQDNFEPDQHPASDSESLEYEEEDSCGLSASEEASSDFEYAADKRRRRV